VHLQESTIYFFKWGLYGTRLPFSEFLASLAWLHATVTNFLGNIDSNGSWEWHWLIFMCRLYVKQGFLWTSRRSSRLARCAVTKLIYEFRAPFLWPFKFRGLCSLDIFHLQYFLLLENLFFSPRSMSASESVALVTRFPLLLERRLPPVHFLKQRIWIIFIKFSQPNKNA
jgi:hypothetical protein